MPPTTTIESRTASLADSDDTIIEGVAIGENDVTRGIDPDSEDNRDILKLWPADALRKGAATLSGHEINPLHSSQSVGEVVDAWYEEGEGVKYRARIDDEALAGHVDAHTVSIEARHYLGEEVDTSRGPAVRVSDPTFTGLAIVQNGAAPSATAETVAAARPDTAICADVRAAFDADPEADANRDEQADPDTDADSDDAMAAEGDVPAEYRFDNPGEAVEKAQEMGFDAGDDADGEDLIHTHGDGADTVFMPGPSHEALVNRLEEQGDLARAALREVSGVSFEDTATGELDESALPTEGYQEHYLYPGDTKTASSYAVVDADGQLRRGNVEAAHALGCRGRCDDPDEHDRRLRALAQEFDSVPQWAMDEAEAAAAEHLEAETDADAEAAAHPMADTIEASDIVSWSSQGDRPAAGRVIETIDEGQYDTELSGDATVNAPAALIRLHRPTGEGEWGSTDVTVAHRTDTETLSVHEEWPALARMQAAHLVDINGTEIDLTPPDYVVSAAEAALDAKEQYDTLADCGTGVGESRAQAIANADLAPSDFTGGENTAIPDYLNSHSEDVSDISDPPAEWGEDTWTDGCGPVQYALWGGTADGRALEWFPDKEADLEAAMEAEAAAGDAQHSDELAESSTGPSGTGPQSTDESMSNTEPDDPEEPSVEELRARLSEKDDRIDDLESEVETLSAKVEATDAAAEEYAAALVDAGETVLSEEDLVDRFTVAELAAKYDETEAATLATPDEDPEPDVRSGADPDGTQTATLSAAEQDEREELKARLAELEEGPLAEADDDAESFKARAAQQEAERIEQQIDELEGNA